MNAEVGLPGPALKLVQLSYLSVLVGCIQLFMSLDSPFESILQVPPEFLQIGMVPDHQLLLHVLPTAVT